MKNFTNVGNNRNMAQSLLLYTKTIRFLQTFCLIKNDKYLTRKLLCETMHSAKSAKVCKFADFYMSGNYKIRKKI